MGNEYEQYVRSQKAHRASLATGHHFKWDWERIEGFAKSCDTDDFQSSKARQVEAFTHLYRGGQPVKFESNEDWGMYKNKLKEDRQWAADNGYDDTTSDHYDPNEDWSVFEGLV